MAETLYLIDGNSLAYRAFFALPDTIATSKGQPTNAIFGFASMLVKIITEHGSNPTIVCWDAGSSGRKELDSRYKANRASRPDLLKEQWPYFEPIVDAFGWTNVSVDGYEADDVIGTLAEKAMNAKPPIDVVVVTGDRDSFQLIDPEGRVRVMATARGITDTKDYDYDAVVERYGIGPELIPDFYGLKGDSSDNIPGVPGIGDKTASELLQRFGSLETILDSVDEISGAKRKENLVNHADDARLSKELATIQRDVPLDLDPAEEVAREPDRSRIREVFGEFELKDPLRRMEAILGEDGLGDPEPEGEELEWSKGSLANAVSLGGKKKPLTVAVVEPEAADGELFARDGGWAFGAACGGEVIAGPLEGPEAIAPAAGSRPLVAHDFKALGVVPEHMVWDTLLAAYLLDPSRRSYELGELCERAGISVQSDDDAARRVAMVEALKEWQEPQILERDQLALLEEMEIPLVPVLRAMEIAGVRLNTEELGKITKKVRREIGALEKKIHKLAGEEFTIGSPQQLGAILFDKLGLTRKRKGKTGYSTDARVLQAIRDEHEIVPLVERWRELNQLLKTYLDVLPTLVDAEGRIHTTFVQAAAATGRLSSVNPNLQNVPVRTELGREIRGCFEAAPRKVLLSADYSQVELRVLAHVADEDVLKEIFKRGEDVHTATAREVFQVPEEEIDPAMRSKAKMINYGIVYGLGEFGLADRLNIPRAEAGEFIDAYLTRFSRIHAFMEETVEQARKDGYVTTLYGRRREIPELRSSNRQTFALGERLAVNTVVQGTSADVMKLAMIEADKALRASSLKSRMILTIHDELLFEGPKGEMDELGKMVEQAMVAPWGDREPPLAVDIGVGRTWLEAK